MVELKNRLERQEAETCKDDSKFKFSLDENEKLKAGFSTERESSLGEGEGRLDAKGRSC